MSRSMLDRFGARRVKSCGKIRYPDELAARMALASACSVRGGARRGEKRTYRCPVCGGWHLTSQDRLSEGPLFTVRSIREHCSPAAWRCANMNLRVVTGWSGNVEWMTVFRRAAYTALVLAGAPERVLENPWVWRVLRWVAVRPIQGLSSCPSGVEARSVRDLLLPVARLIVDSYDVQGPSQWSPVRLRDLGVALGYGEMMGASGARVGVWMDRVIVFAGDGVMAGGIA